MVHPGLGRLAGQPRGRCWGYGIVLRVDRKESKYAMPELPVALVAPAVIPSRTDSRCRALMFPVRSGCATPLTVSLSEPAVADVQSTWSSWPLPVRDTQALVEVPPLRE